MSTLYVYGDSFAAPVESYSWVNLLGSKLAINFINKAISGSSIEKSMLLFTEDYKKNIFSQDDIIIFVLGIPGRLHLDYQNKHPNTASLFTRDNNLDNIWYKINKNYIKWYFLNRDPRLYRLNIDGYLHILKNFSEQNSTIKLILLSVNDLNPIFPLKPIPCNFLLPNISLWKISENEFDGINYESWTEKVKTDIRINHLSLPNVKILADSIFDIIMTNDLSKLNYNSFIKKIFNKQLDKHSYEKYTKKGYLIKIR